VRDICAAQLSGAPHILHSAPFGFALTFESGRNPLEHLVDLGNNLMIPEPQHCISRIAQKFTTALVIVRLISVLGSIEFDYELGLLTNEVGKKWADRKLTTELKSLEL